MIYQHNNKKLLFFLILVIGFIFGGSLILAQVRAQTTIGTAITTSNLVLSSGGNITFPDGTQQATAPWAVSGSNIYNANSGNVGIGISSPDDKLHIAGNIKTTGCVGYSAWMPVPNGSGTTATLNAVAETDTYIVVAVGDSSTVLRTTDIGDTWSNTGITGIPASTNFFGIIYDFANTKFIAAGSSGRIITSSNNTGLTWSSSTSSTSNTLRSVTLAGTGPVNVIAVGDSGTIVRSTDGGSVFSTITSNTTANLNRLGKIAMGTTSVAVGNGGVILRTTDAGATWSSVSSGVTVNLNGTAGIASPTGTATNTTSQVMIAVGDSGTILRSTNGGSSWQQITSPTTNNLQSVFYLEAGVIWNGNEFIAVGDNGVILRSDNLGQTWKQIVNTSTNNLRNLIGTYVNLMVGANGTILRPTDSAILGKSGKCLDLAELYPTHETELSAGAVISIKNNQNGIMVEKARQPYDQHLLGVVSSQPAILIEGGSVVMGEPKQTDSKKVPVALSGRVPVKVNMENGLILVGDPLTSSNTPGVAMKADKPGKIIGFALESFDGKKEESGFILINVALQHYIPSTIVGELQQLKQELRDLKKDFDLKE